MVVLWVETTTTKRQKVSMTLMASLAPARGVVEAGVVAKADQYYFHYMFDNSMIVEL